MKNTLETLRIEIDACDAELMKILKKRFSVAHKIGKIKAKKGLPVRDVKREKLVIEDRVKRGEKYGLSPKLIKALWSSIFKEAYAHQQNNERL
jgi:chorismate mutase/prephenate dehydrogenase